MADEYVDDTPIGDGGQPMVVLDVPRGEESAKVEDATPGAGEANNPPQAQDGEVKPEAPEASEKGEEKPLDAETAAASEAEGKTPEQKASYWRGEYFKEKEASQTRISELESQLAEASATPTFLKLDKPPNEWNPEDDLKEMPHAYRERLQAHEFWTALPRVMDNFGALSPEGQQAIFGLVQQSFEQETGIPFQRFLEVLQSPPTATPTQPNAPQSDLTQRIQDLRSQGYDDNDPVIQTLTLAAAQESRLRQLEAANQSATRQQQQFMQQQQERARQEAQQVFESKREAVWTKALKTFEGSVPQGKEFILDFIKDRAESLVRADANAKGHLDKAQSFLHAATTPQEREQYEKLASGSFAAYAAKVGIAMQAAAKQILDEIAEKEHLRSLVNQQQQTRRDITPGQPQAPAGSREEIMKTKITSPDVAAEMAAQIYRQSRKAS